MGKYTSAADTRHIRADTLLPPSPRRKELADCRHAREVPKPRKAFLRDHSGHIRSRLWAVVVRRSHDYTPTAVAVGHSHIRNLDVPRANLLAAAIGPSRLSAT